MRMNRLAAVVAAIVLAVSMAGSAMASTTDTTNVSLTITSGSQFSVDITGSSNFANQPFSLTTSGNWTGSASYTLEVVDLRGTGAGWNVTASASAFNPAIPGSGLQTSNNGPWWSCMSPSGFCAGPGSISNGVAVASGSGDLINAGPVSIIGSAAGTTSAPQPYGTGTFSTQEAVYYTGFPVALAVNTYTTTITVTLNGSAP